jgi:hypothetical protein
MPDDPAPRDVAAAWRPQHPGQRSVKDITDAIVEPEWGGLRVAAALTVDEAALLCNGEEVPVPDELLEALVQAFTAVDAVVEGHLTTKALETGEGAVPSLKGIERPPILIPRAMRKDVKDDPYVRARDHDKREAAQASAALAALEQGERHAFVATDLLWLDGIPLDGVPALERKRLLDGVLDPSFLVRVTPFVRPSAILTLVTWGQLGFGELSYRAANSHYMAGEENPDWALTRPPQGPQTAPAKPVAPR